MTPEEWIEAYDPQPAPRRLPRAVTAMLALTVATSAGLAGAFAGSAQAVPAPKMHHRLPAGTSWAGRHILP